VDRFNRKAHPNANLTTFAAEALQDFRTVGAVAPSSRFLTQAMLEPLPLGRAKVVVEVGSGTGVMTRALLNAMRSDATLLAFEINARFSKYLRAKVSDPRLVMINASVETLHDELQNRGYGRVDAILSSLAFGFMSDQEAHVLLTELSRVLSQTGVLTQYHYIHGLQLKNGRLKKLHLERMLREHFQSVEKEIIWPNLPPAFVFECRKPVR
jgi:phosphatidylethanolamine/phosphatidyl-N-methylethanolamine N-methyltransferase